EAPALEAKRHFQAGVKLFQSGDFRGALGEFEASHRLRPVAEVQFNIALADAALGRDLDAIAAFQRFLDGKASALPAARKADVERRITTLRARLGGLALTVDPEDSTVFVDGRELAVTPSGPLPLDPGIHVLQVRRPGFAAARHEIPIASGKVS